VSFPQLFLRFRNPLKRNELPHFCSAQPIRVNRDDMGAVK